MNIIEELVSVANELDTKKFRKEASALDAVIVRLSQVPIVDQSDTISQALQANRPTTPPPVDWQAIGDAARAQPPQTEDPELTGPIEPFNDDPNNGGYDLMKLFDQQQNQQRSPVLPPMSQKPLQYNPDTSYGPIQRIPSE